MCVPLPVTDDMETLPLLEYRCSCGKLLFKGALLLCVVEVKCRRCGAVHLTEQLESGVCTFLECDAQLQVTTVSGAVSKLFGYEERDLIGKPLGTFFPLLRDGEANQQAALRGGERAYKIPNNTFLLKDGSSLSLKSYFIPKREQGKCSGYRMLNWINEYTA